jgi:hypothetical protein
VRAVRSEIKRCPHCHARYLIAKPADRRGRTKAVLATPDPLIGTLAVTRDFFGVWRWRVPEPGEVVVPPEMLHIEHPNPCPRAHKTPTAPAQRPQRAVPAAPPPGVISLDQARLRRAQRQQRPR